MRKRLKTLAVRAARHLSPGSIDRYELGKFAERNVAPLAGTAHGQDEHRHGPLLDCIGIDFSLDRQLAMVRSLGGHRRVFEAIRGDPRINSVHGGAGDRVRNGYFPTPDAEVYAAMIAETRPPIIIEVGGGYSTLIARTVIDMLDLETELWVVDPEPRTDVRQAASRLTLSTVEQEGIPVDALVPDSILFIDSSHILRASGDVAYLYGQVLPSLAVGVRVHVHDVFLPFDYSPFATRSWWTEQYVLQVLLSHSPRYQVELALRWLTETDPDAMADLVGQAPLEDPAHGGTSLWVRIASP